jgi:hypothetical protein
MIFLISKTLGEKFSPKVFLFLRYNDNELLRRLIIGKGFIE